MNNLAEQLISSIENLNTYKRGSRRAPHKPLLLLLAIATLKKDERKLAFTDVESTLRPLLDAYAPPVQSRHQPELPYWHLQSDGIWQVEHSADLPRQAGGFPKQAALRTTSAGFPDNIADALLSEPGLSDQVVSKILTRYFPPSLHDDIIAAVGLGSFVKEDDVQLKATQSKRRDPAFRYNVLRAYEHRCAVTGFRAALAGSYFGCEAAHVQWHAYGGPDNVSNGVCIEPTIHKLFDAGAWSLTDDHRILVSKEFTGSSAAVDRLRERHGKPLREPISGEPLISLEYIKWHRDPELGGVFRGPGLVLG